MLVGVVSGWMLAILCMSPLGICATQQILSSKAVTFMGVSSNSELKANNTGIELNFIDDASINFVWERN